LPIYEFIFCSDRKSDSSSAHRICPQIQNLADGCESHCLFLQARSGFSRTGAESFRLRETSHAVFLRSSRRPRLLRPARFKKRGGRANRRRCARWRRFPSDCRSKPHSNMRDVGLCRNFSRRGIRVPLASNKRNTKRASRETQGEAPERVKKTGRTSGITSGRFQASGAAD
jgi:hypothetical protein